MTGFRVAVVLGTRPEIIKLAGVVDGLGDAAIVIHTGQHYDDGLSQVFLDGLGLAAPAHRLELGGLSRAEQVGRGTTQLADLLTQLAPDAVIVQGDTNSALAGALAANATGFPIVHVEAGLRSFDSPKSTTGSSSTISRTCSRRRLLRRSPTWHARGSPVTRSSAAATP